MENQKSDLIIDVQFDQKISRLFIFRGLYMFILIWPAMIIMMFMYFVILAHLVYMFIMGKRAKALFNLNKRLFVWTSKWNAYFGALVDKKPGFWF